MAKIWEPLEMSVYQGWIKAIIEEASDDLSDWESSFVASLEERMSKYGRNLTEPQAVKLEQIYAEKTR
jgi:hypothetical protein